MQVPYLVGLIVSKIEFVHDYLQIGFDGGGGMNIFNDFTVDGCNKERLSMIEGTRLESAEYSKTVFRLTFDNGVVINVCMSDDAFNGPEALQYVGPDGKEVIWRGWEEDTQFN